MSHNELPIGNLAGWEGAYRLQHDSSQQLIENTEYFDGIMQRFNQLGAQALQLGIELGFANTVEMDDLATRRYQIECDLKDLKKVVNVSQEALRAVSEENATLFNAVNDKEFKLGQALNLKEPLPYHVERAIGELHPAIHRRWTQVRGGITAFRLVMGETRENVTLGVGNNEPWSKTVLDNKITEIDRIQVAQILLNRDDPADTAEFFGKTYLLAELGRLPFLTDDAITHVVERPRGWYEAALKACKTEANKGIGHPIDRS